MDTQYLGARHAARYRQPLALPVSPGEREVLQPGSRQWSARDVVKVAVQHLRENETVFLHPAGTCRECDEARASFPGA